MLKEHFRVIDEPNRRVARFDNGLTAILFRHDVSPTAAVRIYVCGGSVFEGEHVGSGISHLFEHLITCDGAGPYDESALMRRADALGGLMNAYTSTDHVCYHATVEARNAGNALEMLSHYVVAPQLSQEVFDRELGVVQRELERDRDDPDTQLEELLNELAYSGHPMAAPIIGYRDRLMGLRRDDLVAYHRRVHVGANLAIVVAGDIDLDSIQMQLAELFGALTRGQSAVRELGDPPALVAPRVGTCHLDVESASATMAWLTVRDGHADDAALDALASILFDGDDARLTKRLRWDEQLVFDVDGSHESAFHTPGLFYLTVQCDPTRLDAVAECAVDEIGQLATRLVTPAEIARAVRQNESTVLYHRETAEGLATQLGEDYLAMGDIGYTDAYLARLRAVTADDILRVARRYLIGRPYCMARILPRRNRTRRTKIKSARQASTTDRTQTAGGLTCLTRSLPGSEFVAVSASFVGGIIAESDATSGAFNALGSVWTRGSARRSADEIAAAFAERGASLRATSGLNQFGLSMVCLARDFDALWPVFHNVLRFPACSEDEWAKVRPSILDGIARQDEQWSVELGRFARRRFFGNRPYARSRLGTTAAIEALDGRCLRALYGQFVRPGNGTIAVAGGIDPAQAAAIVAQGLDDWRDDAPPFAPDFAALEPSSGDRLFIRRSSPDREVAGVFVGFAGLSHRDRSARAAVAVFDTMLAGYSLSSGHLFAALRSGDNDLAYEVAGIGFSGLLPGYIAYAAGCEPARVNDVYRAMRREIDAVREGAFDDEEIERAKAMIRTGELDQLQSAAEIAVRMGVDESLGLGADDSRTFLEEVAAVDSEAVRRTAQHYLHAATIAVTTPEPQAVAIGIEPIADVEAVAREIRS